MAARGFSADLPTGNFNDSIKVSPTTSKDGKTMLAFLAAHWAELLSFITGLVVMLAANVLIPISDEAVSALRAHVARALKRYIKSITD
jgi:uncharacterized protein YybS (DUF2232 family)